MPVAMTFDSLKTDMRRYMERGGVSDTEVYEQIPSLINLAERDIADKLKILGLLNVVTSDLVAGTAVYAKPDRWRRTADMQFGIGTAPNQERYPIYPRAYDYCRRYWPNVATRDIPKFYADYDYQHWLIVPTPIATYPWEIAYWQLPPLLDDSNQTNWLTDYAPNALLSSSLNQAFPFLKDPIWIQHWTTQYASDLSTLNGEDLQRIIDRTTNRREV